MGGGRAPEIRRGAGPTLLVFKQKGELLARSCLKLKTVQGEKSLPEKSLPCTSGAFPAPGAQGGLQRGRGGHPTATAPVPGCWGEERAKPGEGLHTGAGALLLLSASITLGSCPKESFWCGALLFLTYGTKKRRFPGLLVRKGHQDEVF